MKLKTLCFCILALALYTTGEAQQRNAGPTIYLPAGLSLSKDGSKVILQKNYTATKEPDGTVTVTDSRRAVVGHFRCDGCKEGEQGSCSIMIDSDGRTITCQGGCACRLLVKINSKSGSTPNSNVEAEWKPVKTH